MGMKDYSRQKFGKITILDFSHKHQGRYYWNCKCECGNLKEICITDLKTGNTKSCGCLKSDNHIAKIDNLSGTRIHKIYHNMKNRCLNVNNPRYKDYGARGIEICPEWLERYNGFLNFYKWAVSAGYNDTLTLDRIDNDKGYNPENCRFVSPKVQNRNTRRTKNIKIGDREMCVQDWCSFYNIKAPAIFTYAKRNGVSIQEALIRRIILKNEKFKKVYVKKDKGGN